jgi:hypothetical protein
VRQRLSRALQQIKKRNFHTERPACGDLSPRPEFLKL